VGVERGESLSAQVNRLLDGCLNRPELEQKLRNVGYSFEREHVYETPLMTELERRLYRVDSDFPRLTRKNLVGAELPRGVLSVSYEVDLAGDLPEPVGAVDEGNMIAALAGR
jgi:hypothetical protein